MFVRQTFSLQSGSNHLGFVERTLLRCGVRPPRLCTAGAPYLQIHTNSVSGVVQFRGYGLSDSTHSCVFASTLVIGKELIRKRAPVTMVSIRQLTLPCPNLLGNHCKTDGVTGGSCRRQCLPTGVFAHSCSNTLPILVSSPWRGFVLFIGAIPKLHALGIPYCGTYNSRKCGRGADRLGSANPKPDLSQIKIKCIMVPIEPAE